MTKKSVFVIMPFSDDLDDIWEVGIKDTVEGLGFNCYRADGVLTPGFIVDQIYDSISNADLIIGEMTGKNPNVFYEIGIAHALGKPTILFATSTDDLTAFDTRGLRHCLHNKKTATVRKYLKSTLPLMETDDILPTIPGGNVIYEWPSDKNTAPRFEWWCHTEEKAEQIDKMGGQRIESLEPVGKVISITNTAQNWNWYRNFSIMTLISRTHDFKVGDTLTLIVKARTTGEMTLKLVGDGGWLDPENKIGWQSSWKTVTRQFDNGALWTNFVLTAQVEPTNTGYDPATRGTSVFLCSSIGENDLKISKIQLIHKKSES